MRVRLLVINDLKMDLPTLLLELGNALTDRENPESDIIQVNLIEEIRKSLPRKPDEASDLLTGTLMALSLDPNNTESLMNLTMVHSMVPEILAGLQPLPVRPPNIHLGLLMFGEAISRDENLDTKTFYDILVQPFITEGTGDVLSVALEKLMRLTKNDPVPRSHAELAYGWITSNGILKVQNTVDTGPGQNTGIPSTLDSGSVPMDLTEDQVSTPGGGTVNKEQAFFDHIVKLSSVLTDGNELKQVHLLKQMFSIVQGPLSGLWYSEQLNRIMNTYAVEDQNIFNSVLIANEFLESDVKKKMSSDSK